MSDAAAAPAYNVDVKLTVKNDPSRSQFINMTIDTVPAGATQLRGTWRGARVFVPSQGGDFSWDGRAGQELIEAFDGPASAARVVLDLEKFIGAPGKLPGRGAGGTGIVFDPADPAFHLDITWRIT
ncbi:hypothetical protein [Streptomyces roseoverticillatus]|uniref:Uncharacterized protein n=1 Tax=Streptomyces roseoverticillatus TaxID=66429 RepID=A0ABV3ITV1_9ACTN